MVDKKGQQMTLGTIIAIVLGIVVLVFLIFGFSTGWSSMWDRVTGQTTGSNVKLVIADCANDCKMEEQSSWCNEKKSLRFFDDEGKTVKVEGNCLEFATDTAPKNIRGDVYETKNLGFKMCDAIPRC